MHANPTIIELCRPQQRSLAGLYDLAAIVGGSLLVAVCAQVAIGFPVPVSGQTFAVVLIGALLGSRRGALCMLAYLAEGVAGLPVFANAKAGPAVLLGPTGGYLIGFVAAAGLVGWLAEKGWDRRFATTLPAMFAGSAVIYAFGLFWLAHIVGAERALAVGLFPFIPGDILKALLAAMLLPAGWKLLGRFGLPSAR